MVDIFESTDDNIESASSATSSYVEDEFSSSLSPPSTRHTTPSSGHDVLPNSSPSPTLNCERVQEDGDDDGVQPRVEYGQTPTYTMLTLEVSADKYEGTTLGATDPEDTVQKPLLKQVSGHQAGSKCVNVPGIDGPNNAAQERNELKVRVEQLEKDMRWLQGRVRELEMELERERGLKRLKVENGRLSDEDEYPQTLSEKRQGKQKEIVREDERIACGQTLTQESAPATPAATSSSEMVPSFCPEYSDSRNVNEDVETKAKKDTEINEVDEGIEVVGVDEDVEMAEIYEDIEMAEIGTMPAPTSTKFIQDTELDVFTQPLDFPAQLLLTTEPKANFNQTDTTQNCGHTSSTVTCIPERKLKALPRHSILREPNMATASSSTASTDNGPDWVNPVLCDLVQRGLPVGFPLSFNVPETTLEQPEKNKANDWDPGMDVIDAAFSNIWSKELARREDEKIKKEKWNRMKARKAATKEKGEKWYHRQQ